MPNYFLIVLQNCDRLVNCLFAFIFIPKWGGSHICGFQYAMAKGKNMEDSLNTAIQSTRKFEPTHHLFSNRLGFGNSHAVEGAINKDQRDREEKRADARFHA
jgi:hypothetical protein